ncbi:MAG: tRNA lysidine(34) synthetase TilS [Clostridia bacterium]|nr:tRNA lysidine(34) synthetase TilS [Clostridia bacterium]
MEKTVLQTLSKHKMLEGVHTLSVAVSGGADSMALLHLLSRFSSEWGVKLTAVHFNHEIRGEEADADEAFVKKACAEWGIPFISGREDVPDFAKSHKMSMETAARELRYRFLDTLSCDAIATAHTLSDHFETVLLNLTRGSGLKGLCGIPPVRGRYIRPMLDCTRTQIEGYCRDYAISYVTDKTNLSDEYARNRIRHHAVPVLKQINPAVEQAARRLSVSLSEDEQFLSRAAGEALDRCRRESGLSVLQLSGFHPAVAKRVIKRYFEESVPGITLD